MLVQQTSLDTLAKRDDFLGRLSLLPAHLQAGLDLLQNGFRRGYRLPRALRPRILAMIDGDIDEAGLPDAVAKQFAAHVAGADAQRLLAQRQRDRKSTRLISSH